MPINRSTDKKKALLAYKDKLLNDINYYKRRINEDQCSNASTAIFDDSSDSEDDCPFTIDSGPSVNELKSQQKRLQTGLHATQELASLMVLNSKVDVMVEDPNIQGETPVKEPGLWKSVKADCRIDLVPFTMKFYIHQAEGTFGAKSFRSVKVVPAKTAQEVELSKSVLRRTNTPSDAVEVLRSYSVAYRSRRATLARLADKYSSNLFMEPMPEGGYLLKCANLLEISWVLENKWSPVAPFYHKMVFDLENMEECYIKIIRHAHKQLGDPSTDTDQRTLLLAKIITTCLEAQGTQELYESMESDTESVNRIEKRRLTLENEAPEPKKTRNDKRTTNIENSNTKDNKNTDDQIMAPPKSLPKKVRPKGKENTDQNRKSVKRATVENENNNGKKAKTDTNESNKAKQSDAEKNDSNKAKENETEKNKVVDKNSQKKSGKDAANSKEKASVNDNAEIPKKSGKDQTKAKGPAINNAKEITQKSKSKDAIAPNKQESVKDQQKPKITKTKSKNQEVNSEKEEKSHDKDKNDVQKENITSQEKPKHKKTQKVNNETQNAASKDKPKAKNSEIQDKQTNKEKDIGCSKNDPSKNSEIQDKQTNKANKEKETVSSKNDPKPKSSGNQKVINKDKDIATSKNDPNTVTKELNKTKEVIKVTKPGNEEISSEERTVKIAAITGFSNAKTIDIDEIPIMAANNMNDIPKKSKVNDNAAKTKKVAPKTTKSNDQLGKLKKKNDLTKATNKNNLTKQTSVQNEKKSIVDKETKSNEKVSTNAATNEKQKGNTNKNLENIQKSTETNKNMIENNKTQKVIQKAKVAKQKEINKNTVTTDHVIEKSKNSEKSSENRENTKNKPKNNTEIAKNNLESNYNTEKAVKLTNVAIKNKEHSTNINKIITNIGDIKKPAIKSLTHKNFSASKKVARNLNLSGRMIKSGNIAKISKSGKASRMSNENNSASKISKIPMRLSIESSKKKNPLRISPRKLPSSFNSSSESNMKQKNYFTNIPRLLKKPEPKKISK